MLKKCTLLAAGLWMSIISLSADNQMTDHPKKQMGQQQQQHHHAGMEKHHSGGVVLGFGLTTLESARFFNGNAGAAVQFGYYGSCWMFDIGANYVTTPRNHHSVFALGHLGFRDRLSDNLFISYGGMGLGNIGPHSKKQWSAGGFAGLDYQFTRHFMLSGKVYPYTFDHRSGSFRHNYFANSTISLFYVF